MNNSTTEQDIIKIIAGSWDKRSGVRSKKQEANESVYNPDIPDYPLELLPFHAHPVFRTLPEEVKQEILTCAWIIYNKKVIFVEDYVINPGILLLIEGAIPGVNNNYIYKQALRQTLVDEHYHILLHESAVENTRKRRGIESNSEFKGNLFYSKLVQFQDEVSEKWQKQILTFLWALISEVSINAYLELISKNNKIQPENKEIALLHGKDESAHNRIMVEVGSEVFGELNLKQKGFFISYLPRALEAFVAPDFPMWGDILSKMKVKSYRSIISDCENDSSRFDQKFDFSGVRKLVEKIEIDKLGFDINAVLKNYI